MIRHMAWAAVWVAAAQVAPAAGAEIAGKRPGHVAQLAQGFPNEQAVTPRLWVPGIDDGWTPQGLAIMGKHALVSSYQDTDPGKPRCRVFRVELASGADAGSFDMPEPCKHAGGIVDIGGGYVVVADTRQDWKVDLAKALSTGHGEGNTRGMIKLASGFGSAFSFFDGKDLWNGVFATQKDSDGAKIYRVPLALFDQADHTVTRDNALDVMKIPIEVQGAAVDREGRLWLSASYGKKNGRLYRFDRATGAVLAQYDMPPRIENIAFDAEGRLWAVSESGALKYRADPQYFPVIFEIDVAKLR